MLPSEINNLIKEYIYVNCEECNIKFNVDKKNCNITMIYSNEIFNDDFPFPRIYKSFKYICNNCIQKLKAQNIKTV